MDPKVATFSLTSATFHFDTSDTGELSGIQDVTAAFHYKLELATIHHSRAILIQNLERLTKMLNLIDQEYRKISLRAEHQHPSMTSSISEPQVDAEAKARWDHENGGGVNT